MLAIRSDPAFEGGDYYGAPGRSVGWDYSPNRSPDLSQRDRTRRPLRSEGPGRRGPALAAVGRSLSSYLDHAAGKLVGRFDANSYLVLTEAMNSHDVGRDRGGLGAALGRVMGALVVADVDSDRCYPPRLSDDIAAGCRVPIASRSGRARPLTGFPDRTGRSGRSPKGALRRPESGTTSVRQGTPVGVASAAGMRANRLDQEEDQRRSSPGRRPPVMEVGLRLGELAPRPSFGRTTLLIRNSIGNRGADAASTMTPARAAYRIPERIAADAAADGPTWSEATRAGRAPRPGKVSVADDRCRPPRHRACAADPVGKSSSVSTPSASCSMRRVPTVLSPWTLNRSHGVRFIMVTELRPGFARTDSLRSSRGAPVLTPSRYFACRAIAPRIVGVIRCRRKNPPSRSSNHPPLQTLGEAEAGSTDGCRVNVAVGHHDRHGRRSRTGSSSRANAFARSGESRSLLTASSVQLGCRSLRQGRLPIRHQVKSRRSGEVRPRFGEGRLPRPPLAGRRYAPAKAAANRRRRCEGSNQERSPRRLRLPKKAANRQGRRARGESRRAARWPRRRRRSAR